MCAPLCLLAEGGRGRDRLTERGREEEEKKKDRRDQMRERKAEHIAPPHSPTFLWKSFQTTAIGERRGREEHASTHRSAGGHRGKERRGEARSMCRFEARRPETGSNIKSAGRKSAKTELFSSLLWSGRPSPEEPSSWPSRDHTV